ncbi:hypothetical protein Naga_100812g1 [Nannochloropsis gaditana]|uniref:Uncharacterized protein n=1 Tax=Nannochloropsis gaditana TaxID=72520 RepID=W7T9U5_9STRA|nr:hypothetical protein Naga_100812g1 [Nannochloropsis gaditana]
MGALAEVVEAMGGLNADQYTVLRTICEWVCPSLPPSTDIVYSSSPILLVHGVFGSGKSHMLVALCLLLDQLSNRLRLDRGGKEEEEELEGESRGGLMKGWRRREEGGRDGGRDGEREGKKSDFRVLIASATNVAVDNILVQLLEKGYTSLTRIGSSQRSNPALLPYLYAASDSTASSISATASSSVPSSQQSPSQQNQRFASARIAGATIASCFPTLHQAVLATGAGFPFVIIDEASQLMEPLTLLPLLAAGGASRLILVGDPQQLPPPVNMHARDAPPTSNPSSAPPSLGAHLVRPLFQRLSSPSMPPIVLRTQYRCHPTLSKLASDLFYQGQLRDGINREDRGPVVGRLPPLVWIDVPHGSEQQAGGESYQNIAEAAIVVQALQWLLAVQTRQGWEEQPDGGRMDGEGVGNEERKGVRQRKVLEPDDIGIIVPYKAQATLIMRMMKEKNLLPPSRRGAPPSHVKVSTVDAFQGAEREVILYSCVRTGGLGFLDSPNRLNVAITRARRHLVLVGNAQALVMLSVLGRKGGPGGEGLGGGGGGGEGGSKPGMWSEIVRRAVPCSHVQELGDWLVE